MSQETNKVYTKERLETVMNDLKTVVLPQIKAEIEARAKKTALADAVTRIANLESLIGNAQSPDSDNIINKVVEMVDFFSGITEEKTLAGMLSTLRNELTAMKNGFIPTFNTSTGFITMTPTGQATIAANTSTGMIEMTF